MKSLVFFVLTILCCQQLYSQEYRLVYDEQSLPELYNSIYLFAEIKDGSGYRKLSNNKYRLETDEGALDGNLYTFDKQQLYTNNGIAHFNLITGSSTIPLTVQLPILEEININLYTDSIKPILNYYLNVEGKFSNGRVFPLDSSFVTVECDAGSMKGLEWILPKERNFDKVNFTVVDKFRPKNRKQATVYLKKHQDPRDDPNYQDRTEDEIINNRRRK